MGAQKHIGVDGCDLSERARIEKRFQAARPARVAIILRNRVNPSVGYRRIERQFRVFQRVAHRLFAQNVRAIFKGEQRRRRVRERDRAIEHAVGFEFSKRRLDIGENRQISGQLVFVALFRRRFGRQIAQPDVFEIVIFQRVGKPLAR